MKLRTLISRSIPLSAFLAFLFGSALFSLNTLADEITKPKPGLWEHSFTLKSESGQIEAAIAQAKMMMAAMPAEQRKMVENMMKKQGIDLDLDSYKAKICMTQNQIDENGLPKPNENCEQTVTEKITNGYKVAYSCKTDPPVSGEGQYIITDEEHFNIDVVVNTVLNGKPEVMDIKQSGVWLSADCGSLGTAP